jgi:predicted dehydrogenase
MFDYVRECEDLSEKKLRVGVVGLGKMGLVHAGMLNVLPSVELVALCEKSSLIRRLAKKMFKGLEIVDDLQKLSKFGLDAVYVTTPIPSHFPVAREILEKKMSSDLFVEKTLAQTYEESRVLSDLARSLQSVTMVGYLRRFYVTFNKARELLSKDAIGKVVSFEAYAYSSDFLGAAGETNTAYSRGGVLRDLGCHAVDLALWFFGNLKVVPVEAKRADERFGDSVSFGVENAEVTGEFDVSWCREDYRTPEVGFSIAGSRGQLLVNDDQVKLNVKEGESAAWYRHDLNDNVPFCLGLPEYYREDLCFVKSVVEGAKAEPDFFSAAKVDKIIEDVVGEEVQHA